jgi:hypothetical protein
MGMYARGSPMRAASRTLKASEVAGKSKVADRRDAFWYDVRDEVHPEKRKMVQWTNHNRFEGFCTDQ